MSEKKKTRRRKDEYIEPSQQEQEKPTKDEIKVAKWLKKNVKTKKTKFLNHNVEYFSSGKAVDALMKSKFAEGDSPLFVSREQVVEFLDVMLEHKFFHRARKVPVTIEELRCNASESKSNKKAKSIKTEHDVNQDADSNEKEIEGDHSCDQGPGSNNDAATSENNDSQKKEQKRKRKIRLDMHSDQIFVDGSEAYVWIYDPIPIHYWIYGLILLLSAITICLFPLWPPVLRKGVYYLSVAAAGFLVFIIALTILRLIVFTIVWAVTLGKLHLWLFPNLTEDVGFFASFWPLCETKYIKDESDSNMKNESKSKEVKKTKNSDNEETFNVPLAEAKDKNDIPADSGLRKRKKCKVADKEYAETKNEESNSSEPACDTDAKSSHSESESESEISGRDYEIISPSDVQAF